MYKNKPRNSKTCGKTLVVLITMEQTTDDTEISSLRESLRACFDQGEATGFVMNLQDLKLLPSEILAIFVELHRIAPNRVKLCNVHSNIRETLKRTQLIRLFEVCDGENEALVSLAVPSLKV